jgi:hypothetical protein
MELAWDHVQWRALVLAVPLRKHSVRMRNVWNWLGIVSSGGFGISGVESLGF